MKTPILLVFAFLMSSNLVGFAQQDTARARPDSLAVEKILADSLKHKAQLPAVEPAARYQIDTSFEARNLEAYYYGLDGVDATYETNPWDEYLFQDADGREEDERDQRDQERDSRE